MIHKYPVHIQRNDFTTTMTAHLQPFYCSLCRNHLGNIVCRTVEDIKEIYNLCSAKESTFNNNRDRS